MNQKRKDSLDSKPRKKRKTNTDDDEFDIFGMDLVEPVEIKKEPNIDEFDIDFNIKNSNVVIKTEPDIENNKIRNFNENYDEFDIDYQNYSPIFNTNIKKENNEKRETILLNQIKNPILKKNITKFNDFNKKPVKYRKKNVTNNNISDTKIEHKKRQNFNQLNMIIETENDPKIFEITSNLQTANNKDELEELVNKFVTSNFIKNPDSLAKEENKTKLSIFNEVKKNILNGIQPVINYSENFNDITKIEVIDRNHVNNNLLIYDKNNPYMVPCLAGDNCHINKLEKHPNVEKKISGCSYLSMEKIEKIKSIFLTNKEMNVKLKEIENFIKKDNKKLCEICYRFQINSKKFNFIMKNGVPIKEIPERYYLVGEGGWNSSGMNQTDPRYNINKNNNHAGIFGNFRKLGIDDFTPCVYELNEDRVTIKRAYYINENIENKDNKILVNGYKEINHIYHLNDQVIFNFNQIGNNGHIVYDIYNRLTIENIIYYQIEGYLNIEQKENFLSYNTFLDLIECIENNDVVLKAYKYLMKNINNLNLNEHFPNPNIIKNPIIFDQYSIFILLILKLYQINTILSLDVRFNIMKKILNKLKIILQRKIKIIKENTKTLKNDEIFSDSLLIHKIIVKNYSKFKFIYSREYIKTYNIFKIPFYYIREKNTKELKEKILNFDNNDIYKLDLNEQKLNKLNCDCEIVLNYTDLEFISNAIIHITKYYEQYKSVLNFVILDDLDDNIIKDIECDNVFSLDKIMVFNIEQKINIINNNIQNDINIDNKENSEYITMEDLFSKDLFEKKNKLNKNINDNVIFYKNLFKTTHIENYHNNEKIEKSKISLNRKINRDKNNENNKNIFVILIEKINEKFKVIQDILKKQNEEIKQISFLPIIFYSLEDVINYNLNDNDIFIILKNSNYFKSILPNVNDNKRIIGDSTLYNITNESINNVEWKKVKILLLVLYKVFLIQKLVRLKFLDKDDIYYLKLYQLSHLNIIKYYISNIDIKTDEQFLYLKNDDLHYNSKFFSFNTDKIITFDKLPDVSSYFTDPSCIEYANFIENIFIKLNCKLVDKFSESRQFLKKIFEDCKNNNMIRKYVTELFYLVMMGLFPEILEIVNFEKVILYEEFFLQLFKENNNNNEEELNITLFTQLFDEILSCTKFSADVFCFGFYEINKTNIPFINSIYNNYLNWSPINIISNINLSIYLLNINVTNNNIFNFSYLQKNIYNNINIRQFKKIIPLYLKYNFIEFIDDKIQNYDKKRDQNLNKNNKLSYDDMKKIEKIILALNCHQKIPFSFFECIGLTKETIKLIENIRDQYDTYKKKIEFEKKNYISNILENNFNNDYSKKCDFYQLQYKSIKNIDYVQQIELVSTNQYLRFKYFFKIYYNLIKINITKIRNVKVIKKQIKSKNSMNNSFNLEDSTNKIHICLICFTIKNIISNETKFGIGNEGVFGNPFEKNNFICSTSKKKNKLKTSKKNIENKIHSSTNNTEKRELTRKYKSHLNSITELCNQTEILRLNLIGNVITIPNPNYIIQSNKLKFLNINLNSFMWCPDCSRFTILDSHHFTNNGPKCNLPKYDNNDLFYSKKIICFCCLGNINNANNCFLVKLFDDETKLNFTNNFLCYFCRNIYKNYKFKNLKIPLTISRLRNLHQRSNYMNSIIINEEDFLIKNF